MHIERSRKLLLLAVIGAIVSLLGSGVTATTWRVPSESPSIHAGLDSAAYGDTVLVAPGTYLETEDPQTWVSLSPGVTLVSEEGADLTIIEFCNTSTGVGLRDCEGALVSGFTVRFAARPGCGYPGGWIAGIYCSGCTDVTVENCVIENVGFGIWVYGESQGWWRPVFRDITIRNCGTGVRCADIHQPGRPHFLRVSMTHCDIGAEMINSSPYFESCVIMYCSDFGLGYWGSCGGSCDKCVIAHNEDYGVFINSDPPLAAPSFNGSWLPENANDIYDNGGWDMWYAHSQDEALVMAIYNCWGADCPDFGSSIYGRVDYSPWIDSTHVRVLTEDDCFQTTEPSTWGRIKASFR